MAGRLDLSGDEFREHVRAQTRLRVRKHRAGGNATEKDGNATRPPKQEARNVTPARGARVGPRLAKVPQKTPSSPRGNPRVAAVVEALEALGLTAPLTPRDCKAIKDSPVEPERLAAAYAAAKSGAWDNAWLQANLSMELVVYRYAGYEATRAAPKRSPAHGPYHQPHTQQGRNPGPPDLPLFEGPVQRIEPAEMARFIAERADVPLADKVARWKGGPR